MTDIVEQARSVTHPACKLLVNEMADEIERLREHVAALRLVATSHEPEALRLQAEIERLKMLAERNAKDIYPKLWAEIERLRAVIVRAKDALLDGQSTQWVHDLLADALRRALEHKP